MRELKPDAEFEAFLEKERLEIDELLAALEE